MPVALNGIQSALEELLNELDTDEEGENTADLMEEAIDYLEVVCGCIYEAIEGSEDAF